MWNKRLQTRVIRILVILGVLLALAVAGVIFAVNRLVREHTTQNSMPQNGVISLYEQSDGTVYMAWPVGIGADSYTLEVSKADTGEILFSQDTEKCSCTLSGLPREERLTLRVRSNAWQDGKLYPGSRDLSVNLRLKAPAVSDVQWDADPYTGMLTVSAQLDSDTACRAQIMDAHGVVLGFQELVEGKAAFRFGDNGGYPLPGEEESYILTLTAYRKAAGLDYYGVETVGATVNRELFEGNPLELIHEPAEGNALKLSWNETRGDYYELQMYEEGSWKRLHMVRQGQELSYVTESLQACRDYRFRVVARSDPNAAGESETLATAQCQVTTGVFTQYATVWPLIDLPVYTDTGKSSQLGTAPAGSAYCVLSEESGMFRIRLGNETCYVDSSYCMINLPDYMGNLCSYDIANSYGSLFKVHDYAIPNVTGTVVKGYEHMQQKNGEFLVPLLYPAAKKLVTAAEAARAEGYRLKIYEAFRPREATLAVYDLTQAIVQNIVPQHPEGLTYEQLMTDSGRYALSNFLAKGISNHNRGIALDLTLETLNAVELSMQTPIHDLSWYSEPAANNENANTLRKIMTDAGLTTLDSEWWHFQDEEAKQNLAQMKPLQSGVNAQCWVKDNFGWRYRTAEGSWLKDGIWQLDGISYTFDAQGYATEQ